MDERKTTAQAVCTTFDRADDELEYQKYLERKKGERERAEDSARRYITSAE